MNILHLTSSRFFGGPERQMLGLAEALHPDVETSFASFSEGGRNAEFLNHVRQAGFQAVGLQHDTPKLLAARNEVSQLIQSNDMHVLLCHGYKAGIVGWFAARKAGIPAIAVSRGWTGEDWKVRMYERLDRLMLRRMDRVVCVSHGQAEKVKKLGVRPDRIEVIHNAIDCARFTTPDPLYRKQLLDFFPESVRGQVRFVAGSAGRLSPEKGFDILIEAAKPLLLEDPQMGFILFGEGGMRETLQAQIDQACIGNRFRLVGYTDSLDQFMPCLDLFVQSSHTEGLPNVLLEATAAGVPIVATDVGGTVEVVQSGEYCQLLEPGDSKRLSESILKIKTASGPMPNSSERLSNEFGFLKQRERYLSLFHSLSQGTITA